MFKLVDGSAKLGLSRRDLIDTEEKLYAIVKEHFSGLIDSKTDDEKLFWALSTIYVVSDDCIFLRDRIGTRYPIFDVDVCKSDETSIDVKPYKIDYYDEYTINKLIYTSVSDLDTVDPLDVMGWSDKVNDVGGVSNGWRGAVWIRSGFTGWNCINVSVDKKSLY